MRVQLPPSPPSQTRLRQRQSRVCEVAKLDLARERFLKSGFVRRQLKEALKRTLPTSS